MRPAGGAQADHEPGRQAPRHEEEHGDRRQDELRAGVHAVRDHKIVAGSQAHAGNGGADAARRGANRIALTQVLPDRQAAGDEDKPRHDDGDEAREPARDAAWRLVGHGAGARRRT